MEPSCSSLFTYSQRRDPQAGECSVCLTPLATRVLITRCNHIFHGICVARSASTCPTCRTTHPLGDGAIIALPLKDADFYSLVCKMTNQISIGIILQ